MGISAACDLQLQHSSLPSVNRELVQKASGKDRLVVHSTMERDVGLLRLYPGIPASLVGILSRLLPILSCLLGLLGL